MYYIHVNFYPLPVPGNSHAVMFQGTHDLASTIQQHTFSVILWIYRYIHL